MQSTMKKDLEMQTNNKGMEFTMQKPFWSSELCAEKEVDSPRAKGRHAEP